MYIDGQFLRGRQGESILKEFSAFSPTQDIIRTFLFKPPYSAMQIGANHLIANAWIVQHYHRIGWEDGSVRYGLMPTLVSMLTAGHEVRCADEEKADFFKQIAPNTHDIVAMGLTLPQLSQTTCFNHRAPLSRCTSDVCRFLAANDTYEPTVIEWGDSE